MTTLEKTIISMFYTEEEKYCYLNTSSTWETNTTNKFNTSQCYEEADKSFKERDTTILLIDGLLLPSIALMGVLGNFCGIVCFRNKCNQTYYALMVALAMSDLGTIVSFVLYYSLPLIYHPNEGSEELLNVSIHGWMYPVLYFFQLTGIYLTISLCFERYQAICRPLSHRFQRTSAYTYIVPTILGSFAYNLPMIFERKVDSEIFEKWLVNSTNMTYCGNTTLYETKPTSLGKSSVYFQVYHTALKLVIKSVIPYICLISLNVCVVKTLYSAKYSVIIDKNSSGSINERQKDGSERQMKATMKSLKSVDLNGEESDALCIHVSNRHRYLRQSQIDLAIINLMIALVFLTSYSLVWVWAVYDFVCYLSPDTDPEMHVKVSRN